MNKIDTSVMYIEDDKISREYAQKMLELTISDYEVAKDGKDALNKILEEKYLPQYIITDLKMPEINGLDLVAYIKKIDNYKPRIIMITGHTEIEKLEDILKDEVIGVLQKPIDFREILNIIKNDKGIS